MGSYGQLMHELSSPENFACNLNRVLRQTRARHVFVATNSGSADEVAVVKRLTGAPVLLLRDLHMLTGWKHEYEALVAEMFLCMRAERFLMAGAGDLYMASSISRLIVRMRRTQSFAADTHALLEGFDPSLCETLKPEAVRGGSGGSGASQANPAAEARGGFGGGVAADPYRTGLEAPHAADGTARPAATTVQEGWEDSDEGGHVWRGLAGADSKECCPGGTAVAGMGCAQLRAWLVCVGAAGDDDALSCSEGAAAWAGLLAGGLPGEIAAALPHVDAARVVACRSFETRGVVYSAYDLAGPRGLATLLELRHSIFSLRYPDPAFFDEEDLDASEAAGFPRHDIQDSMADGAFAFLGVTVITDVHVDSSVAGGGMDPELLEDLRRMQVQFLHVDAEGQLHSAFKLRAMLKSPYKRTLYLDKDTVVCQSVTDAFEMMPRFDFIATQASVSFYEGQPEAWSAESGLHPVPTSYIQYCAAVVFFRQSARVRDMLVVAVREADRLYPHGYLDQAALRNALYHAPRVRDFALPARWQCRGSHACASSYGGNQIVQDRGSFVQPVGESCVILHQHAVQDTDPRQRVTSSWAVKPSMRARNAWDQGLYTRELYPSGIPSRNHYLRNQRSPLFADLVDFSGAWMRAASPAAQAAYAEVAAGVLGASKADLVQLWNRQWEYPFHISSLRHFQRHIYLAHDDDKVAAQARAPTAAAGSARGVAGGGRLRVLVAGGEGGFFPHYLASKLRGWDVTVLDEDAAILDAYREMQVL